MRVLHLIESIGSPPCPAVLAMVRDGIGGKGGAEHVVCVVGPMGLVESADQVGLRVDEHLTVGGGGVWPAWWALRRYLRGSGTWDVVQAWSLSGAGLAGAAAGRDAGRVAVIGHGTGVGAGIRRGDRWARRVLRHRPAELLAVDGSVRDELVAAGLDAGRVHVVEPGLNAGRGWSDGSGDGYGDEDVARRALRMSWGVTGEERVVAVLGDPPRGVDAMLGMLGVGLAAEAGRPVRMLVSANAGGLGRARRVAKAVGRRRFLIVDEAMDRPWEVLGGCDMALVLGGGLSGAWAMAMGVATVAQKGGAMGAWLVDGESGLLARPGAAGELARRVCRLSDDPAEAARLGAAAKREAEVRFDVERFRSRLEMVYQQVRGGGVGNVIDVAGAARSEGGDGGVKVFRGARG